MGEPDGSEDHYLEVEEAELSSDDDVIGTVNGEGGTQGVVDPAVAQPHANSSDESGTGSAGDSSESGSANDDGDDNDPAHDAGVEEEEEEYQIEELESGVDDEFDEQGQDSGDNDAVLEERDVSGEDSSAEEDDADDEEGDDSDKQNGDRGSDSESEVVRRRAPRRGVTSFKMPVEMRDNAGDFFRRSSRQSVQPNRFAAGDDAESSDGAADADSDFDGDDDEDDASEYDGSYGATKTAPRRPKAKTLRRQTRKAARNEVDDLPISSRGAESSEGSDGDWANGPSTGKRRGRRKPKRRARPVVHMSEDDDDDVARTIRINARTGGAVNYAEAGDEDSDIFNEHDAAVSRAAKEAAANPDPNVEWIEAICDYRVPDAEESAGEADGRDAGRKMPLADFNPNKCEFFIKWAGKSFRRNTWNRLDELRHVKGFKRLTNYCKKTLERRDELQFSRGTSDEWEDAAVLASENRDALLEYTHIDRIIDERESKEDGDEVTEYLVKWQNLPYKEATWEPASVLQSEDDLKAIDWYSDRIQAARAETAKRFNPFGKEPRSKFRRMSSQPDYLHGEGRTLREYQLAGLNWLAFSWSNNRNVILADEMGTQRVALSSLLVAVSSVLNFRN